MESKRYTYYVDPEADRKFAGHIEFLARVSEMAAMRLYEEYRGAIHFIEHNAVSCPLYYSHRQTDVELRSWLFGKRYRIVFEVQGDVVYVYDIQDCRQDPGINFA